jgi:hypothetical protein
MKTICTTIPRKWAKGNLALGTGERRAGDFCGLEIAGIEAVNAGVLIAELSAAAAWESRDIQHLRR